ncbi:hypothetical protein C2E23DRAFT_511714 [Lenzites betulinus]|nr:hypothetical protein C2E23DRAFT_511714 [Lenzites betulinus]
MMKLNGKATIYLQSMYTRITRNPHTLAFLLISLIHCLAQGFVATFLYTEDASASGFMNDILHTAEVPRNEVALLFRDKNHFDLQMCTAIPVADGHKNCTTLWETGMAVNATSATVAPRALSIEEWLNELGHINFGRAVAESSGGFVPRSLSIEQWLQELGHINFGRALEEEPSGASVTRELSLEQSLQELGHINFGRAADASSDTFVPRALSIEEWLNELGNINFGRAQEEESSGMSVPRALSIEEWLNELGHINFGRALGEESSGASVARQLSLEQWLQELGHINFGREVNASSETVAARELSIEEWLNELGHINFGRASDSEDSDASTNVFVPRTLSLEQWLQELGHINFGREVDASSETPVVSRQLSIEQWLKELGNINFGRAADAPSRAFVPRELSIEEWLNELGHITFAKRSSDETALTAIRDPSTKNVTAVEMTYNNGANSMVLSEQCARMLQYPGRILLDSQREDVALIGFQLYLLGISTFGILWNSVPHIWAVVFARVLQTSWAAYTVWCTTDTSFTYRSLIVDDGTPCNFDFIPSYFNTRLHLQIPGLVLSVTALISTTFLAWHIVRSYSPSAIHRAGPPQRLMRLYKFFLIKSTFLQLSLFFTLTTVSLWIDQLRTSEIADLAQSVPLYYALFVFIVVTIIPWMAMGYFSVLRENKLLMAGFLLLNVCYIAGLSAMLTAQAYVWTFTEWPFFGCMTVVSLLVLLGALVFGIVCWTGFRKGLAHYLHVEALLAQSSCDADQFTNNDSEKAYIPDMDTSANKADFYAQEKGAVSLLPM